MSGWAEKSNWFVRLQMHALSGAFNYASTHVIRARVKLCVQQCLGVLQMKVSQLLEFASVHPWRTSNLAVLRRQTGLIYKQRSFSRYFSAAGFAGSSRASLVTLSLSL